jgi:protein-tyrosine sulfotransferase
MAAEACFALSDGTLVRPSNPFFITGSGRCGTTLMRRLVIERTHAVIPPENYILALSLRLMAMARGDWSRFCGLVLAALQKYSGRWEDFGIEQTMAFDLLTNIPSGFQTIANFWHAFHAIYANRVNKPGDTRWGDKTPSNVDGLAEVIQIFPQARFIFMVRDVYDMSYSLGSMATSGRAGDYLGGAKRWVDANTRILAFKEQYAAQAMVVRYEDLARFPEREMAAVLAHLGVTSAGANGLNALEAQDMAAQPYLKNVLEGVSSAFIGKGRANMTDDVKEMISGIAAPLQIRMGYEPTGIAFRLLPGAKEERRNANERKQTQITQMDLC